MDLSSLLKVQIDFEQSHLFFPALIHWIILFLLIVIAIVHGIPFFRAVTNGERKFVFAPQGFDPIRFFGACILTVIYVLAMQWIGDFFPNQGIGFLTASMGFMLLLALLFVHDIDRGKFVVIVLNAIVAPTVAWLVLMRLFRITLP